MQNSRYNKNFSMFYREQLTGQAKIYSRFIFDLIKDKPIEHSIIDYMCGTGELLQYFKSKGWETTGIDLSEDMLNIAKKYDTQTKFICEDATKYQADRRYGLAVSTTDALNHLASISDVKKVFENVYKSLKGRGYFIFDMNSPKGIESDNGYVSISNDRSIAIREGFVDSVNKVGFSRFQGCYDLKNDGNYIRFDNTIYNYMHDISEIVKLLEDVGFTLVEMRDGYSDTIIDKNEINIDRILFIAQKKSLVKKH
ncbi:class I SAM-dependent DNA methyltransferase [Streptococcus anginosus]|uniref:class I SAM-dependent DNA methyltransferase n=1 Tax=Streptococcus anginosus TaxID=1328 RepID=UPI00200064B5|nr:methyltransferase domain-containing protein [Streptococcus anginosus]